MRIFLLMLTLLLATNGISQTVPSSCDAPDTVQDHYRDDVAKLVTRLWYANGDADTSNVLISGILVDSIMKALVAVYNAPLPERDTVVNIFNIHAFTPATHRIHMLVDLASPWHASWSNMITLTGSPAMDAMLNQYQLQIAEYTAMSTQAYAEFESPLSLNVHQLGNLFNGFSGISDAVDLSPFYIIPTESFTDIHYSATPSWQELVYRFGWGDCPSGCSFNHFWKFRIYPDCSVEMVSSYGNPLNNGTIIIPPLSAGTQAIQQPTIYPNPFTERIAVDGVANGASFELRNSIGSIVAAGKLDATREVHTPGLAAGFYLLRLKTTQGVIISKLLKAGAN